MPETSTNRAPLNRSLSLSLEEKALYFKRLIQVSKTTNFDQVINRTINQDMRDVIPCLPSESVDLLILDPPYNLAKDFNGKRFSKRDVTQYSEWMRSWFFPLLRLLKPTASVYVCGEWLTSVSIYEVLSDNLTVRNRITWEREKGRGAKTNWKNSSEDIWFATVSNDYVFNVDLVKLKRRVLAPYRESGKPKDWKEEEAGNFRLTSASNLWSDITIPFWSMPENTPHPTQKPEKLVAKLLLASSEPGDVVLDPFLGSGTTSVVARKLERVFIGIEMDEYYCCIAEKRLEAAQKENSIQGYVDNCFWERNTLREQLAGQERKKTRSAKTPGLFDS